MPRMPQNFSDFLVHFLGSGEPFSMGERAQKPIGPKKVLSVFLWALLSYLSPSIRHISSSPSAAAQSCSPNLKRNQALSSGCWWWTGALPRWNTSSSCGAWEKRGKLLSCSWLLPHEQAICFSSLIWLSRNKSVQKSRFSRIVKNSREFSLLDLDLEAFWFHFSLLEKEWKHFDFTWHFSKKSESIFFHFAVLEKEWKLFIFTSRTSKPYSRWSLLSSVYIWFYINCYSNYEGVHTEKIRWVIWSSRCRGCGEPNQTNPDLRYS